MEITFILSSVAGLVFLGFRTIWTASTSASRSYIGKKALSKMSEGKRVQRDLWLGFPFNKLLKLTSRIVFVDDATEASLGKKLGKAGLTDTPRQYTAKKCLYIALVVCLMFLCIAARFYPGVVISPLITSYLLLKQREALTGKIEQKDFRIAQEMPRFVRTICRNLQNNRDLYNVIATYRKVAGEDLGLELDILLAEMQAGNTQNALAHFENRIGTPESFRLCGALRDMSMGIDQTATLSYLADSMASQAKENIRKELSLRPGKMRRTYYPAIAICIAMIMYVLVVYVINNLNNIM